MFLAFPCQIHQKIQLGILTAGSCIPAQTPQSAFTSDIISKPSPSFEFSKTKLHPLPLPRAGQNPG